MRIIYLPLIVTIICSVSCVLDKENIGANSGNVENLKTLRNSVNFAYKAGNEYLNLIRGWVPSYTATAQSFKIFGGKEVFKLMDLHPIYLPFIGYICLALSGLFFVVLVPIVGLCFCLCRCAGKCGGKIKGMDPKHAKCKRYSYTLFLGIIAVVQLAGIVLAFINNQLIHDTLSNPSAEINAVKQLQTGSDLLRDSLKNISEAIQASEQSPINVGSKTLSVDFLNATCSEYFNVFQMESDKVNVNTNLMEIFKKLEEIIKYMNRINVKNTEKLQNYANEFRTEISSLKPAGIRSQVCSMIADVMKLDFDDLNRLMTDQVKGGFNTGKKLRDIVKFFNETFVEHLNYAVTNFNAHVKTEYLEYRVYICIGICCLLLLIVLFYFLGLCFGQCGERPFEDARICNRGVGANLMMAGVAFAFLFTPAIMVFEMSLFMSGGTIQTELCRYFYDSSPLGVRTLDRVLQTIPMVANNSLVNSSIIDSIVNKCPKEPMTIAFKLGNKLMNEEIKRKIANINGKISEVPKQTKKNIIDGYFKSIEGLLLNISAYIKAIEESNSGIGERAKGVIGDHVTGISSEINRLSMTTVKDRLTNSFGKVATVELERTIIDHGNNALKIALLNSYDNVRCDGLSRSAKMIVDSVCVTFLWPFNGFWYGVGICLIFTIPGIIFAVKLAGLYRRTEKYSADYEEPDYNSYMGFYTNNADNIPMKRPKSAKSNQKNRSSNSNNKDGVKQNNPQYLPVYPYDAYE